jgi:3-hydroxyacyl-[acyl-carrier-protein] dehydratase
MRFRLLDRIVELEPGQRITAVKSLTGDEDYLKDHFPLFPVMPGVLMLEALYQASAWLIYKTDDFAHALVLLKEARNVKYADFVVPGRTLTVTAEIIKREGDITTLKAAGQVERGTAVSARLLLSRSAIVERAPMRQATDPYTRQQMRDIFEELYQPITPSKASA